MPGYPALGDPAIIWEFSWPLSLCFNKVFPEFREGGIMTWHVKHYFLLSHLFQVSD